MRISDCIRINNGQNLKIIVTMLSCYNGKVVSLKKWGRFRIIGLSPDIMSIYYSFMYFVISPATYSAIFTGTALPIACSIDDVVPTNSNDSGKD